MSTDVVVFRTERIAARVATAERLVSRAYLRPDLEGPTTLGSIEEIERGHGAADALAERLAAARDRLSQLTFYLLDAESWR
jgi:hypothetical protein